MEKLGDCHIEDVLFISPLRKQESRRGTGIRMGDARRRKVTRARNSAGNGIKDVLLACVGPNSIGAVGKLCFCEIHIYSCVSL